MRLIVCLLVMLGVANGQPTISKVANAASLYVPPADEAVPGLGVAGGSIIAIFGENLAQRTAVEEGFPLPCFALADAAVPTP